MQTPPLSSTSWYGADILEECKRLRKTIHPITDRYRGPQDKINYTNTLYPFILLLGNHSSGKSSFINYLLQRKVQSTGVAPTDDNFTIIGPGEEDIDRNGPAFIGDPDLGFSALKVFGPVLVNHTQLKVRSNTALKDFMLVDSPGMIDSPVGRNTSDNDLVMERGYNFEAVCRWYAERADVILLFFDPDKPGTTGETLSILTNSLVGFDHKLYIVLNKADQFHKIHDFARAYGSLCWNLSKVIPRKDLPRIYTMCLPMYTHRPSKFKYDSGKFFKKSESEIQKELQQLTHTQETEVMTSGRSEKTSFFDQEILDLEEGRMEVIKEVFNAPKRRVDNEISRLFESVNAQLMHCKIVDQAVKDYQYHLWTSRLLVFSTGLASVGLTVGTGYIMDALFPFSRNIGITTANEIPPSIGDSYWEACKHWVSTHQKQTVLFGMSLAGFIATSSVAIYDSFTFNTYAETYSNRKTYEKIFQKLYSKEIADNDEFTQSIGNLVIDQILHNISPADLELIPYVSTKDYKSLKQILTEDISNLRRRASPNFPMLTPPPKTEKETEAFTTFQEENKKVNLFVDSFEVNQIPTPAFEHKDIESNISSDFNSDGKFSLVPSEHERVDVVDEQEVDAVDEKVVVVDDDDEKDNHTPEA